MRRTQISLTEQQHAALARRADQEGTSMAALIREALDRMLAEDWGVVRDRALGTVGRFQDEATDVARDHDRYLADAFGDA
ncbi:MAG: ribbon-helix-helix domain-containing protein [Actinomycetota bacterium]|nr:ribbon-helix-helix domain-containing protein [Actinomycetota bacterium]